MLLFFNIIGPNPFFQRCQTSVRLQRVGETICRQYIFVDKYCEMQA
ncbi:hypothetical protein Mpsy_2433 [Methanolobus psychrophilus R15]|nr:hypothetical protein Mpsy_2433 [Methanolobus psychrophilus R15]